MENLTDDQLAQTGHAFIVEAEARAQARGSNRTRRALAVAHKALHAAGMECVEDPDIEVSPMSIGGDKVP